MTDFQYHFSSHRSFTVALTVATTASVPAQLLEGYHWTNKMTALRAMLPWRVPTTVHSALLYTRVNRKNQTQKTQTEKPTRNTL